MASSVPPKRTVWSEPDAGPPRRGLLSQPESGSRPRAGGTPPGVSRFRRHWEAPDGGRKLVEKCDFLCRDTDTVNSGTIAGRKGLRRRRSINPFAQRLRIEPGELIEQGLNVRLDHERIEVLLLQEPFSLDMGQEFQQGSVETANVEQANGLAMQVKLSRPAAR